MVASWFLFAFLAVLLWVAGVMIDKYLISRYFRKLNDHTGGVGTLVLFSAFFSIFVVVAVFLLKNSEMILESKATFYGILGGLFNASWLTLYLKTIDKTELSRAIPIFQIIPVFGYLLAFWLLGEKLPPSVLFSAVIITAGAFVLSYHFNPSKSWFDYGAFANMTLAAFFVACSEVSFKISAEHGNYWNSVFWFSGGVFLGGLFLYIAIGPYRRQFNEFVSAHSYRLFSFNGINEVIDNLANFVFAFALTLGPVALVMTVNAYQPLVILLVSAALTHLLPNYYDEDLAVINLSQKLAGIVIISAGSVYLYWSL